jgi:outer membrane lipoprotein-sorting protein
VASIKGKGIPVCRARVLGALAVAAAAGIAGCGGASPTPAPVRQPRARPGAWRDAKAEAILEQMREAIRHTQTLTAEVQAVSRTGKSLRYQLSGTVALKRPNLERLQLRGVAPDLTVSDGQTLFRYDSRSRSYTESQPGANGGEISTEFFEAVDVFWRDDNVAPDLPGAFLKYGGVEKADGSAFDVVEYQISDTTIRYFVSPKDHLLYRVVRRSPTPKGTAVQMSALRHVRANVPLDERLFRWAPPPGARLAASAGAAAPQANGNEGK